MRFLPFALLLAAPAFSAGHDGAPLRRTAPELSDLALFVFAAVAIWLTRRALRRRFATKD